MAEKPDRSKKVVKSTQAPLAARAKDGPAGEGGDDDQDDEGAAEAGEAKPVQGKAEPGKGEPAKPDAAKASEPAMKVAEPAKAPEPAKAEAPKVSQPAMKAAEPAKAPEPAPAPEPPRAAAKPAAPVSEDPDAPSPPPGPAGPGDHRTMLGNESGQQSFVEVKREGTKLVIRQGKVGVRGVVQVKDYGDEGRAAYAFAIYVSETSAKGYSPIR